MAAQLLAALNALYHHDDPKVKEEADAWLENWQQGLEAWSVADSVLHDPGSAMEAHWFCAQTLRTKVQRDFEELPDHAIDSLRESLFTLLLKYCKGAPPVRTQLCLALACMSVHVPANRWGDGGVVRWFANKFQSVPAESALPCLLELLTVLPQEANSTKVSVRPERRRQHTQELRVSAGMALEILTSCLAQPGDRTREQVLEAFGAWLRLSEGRSLGLDGAALSSHPLVLAALDGLKSTDTFYASVDAVCELVWVTVDPETSIINQAMMPLIQVVVPAVMDLRPRFAVASRRLQAEYEGRGTGADVEDEFDDDEDTAKGMARLFAEVAEAYIYLIATAVEEVRAPVEAMLEVASYPDFSICSMSFNFWAKLAKQLRSNFLPRMNSGTPADQGLEAAANEQQRRRAYFTPAFEKLAMQIRGRVRFLDASASWSREASQEFKRQRYEVADTLEDVASVIGFNRCLAIIVEPLQKLSDLVAVGSSFDWRTAEAALYCVKSISRYATNSQDSYLLQLLRALPGLPKTPQLQYTACCVVSEYATWLGMSLSAGHSDVGVLQSLLQFVVAALDIYEAAAAAASALTKLSECCGSQMLSCMDSLFALYNRVLLGGVASKLSQAATHSLPSVAEDNVHQVIRGVCTATCKCLPADQLPAAAATLVQPVLSALQQAVAQLPPPPAPSLPASQPASQQQSICKQFPYLVPLIDRLASVFTSIHSPVAAMDVLGRSWPTLDLIFLRCGDDVRVVERTCRALRYGIKSSDKACGLLFGTLLDVLPARFRATRHSAFLYIVSELVKVFGDEPMHDLAMGQILTGLLVESCSGLKRLEDVESNAELVDDTYLLAARAVGYCPRIVAAAATPVLPALLDTALVGVMAQHRDSCGSVLAFLIRLLDPGMVRAVTPDAAAVVVAMFGARAPLFVRLLLTGVAGALPLMMIPDVSATLMAILRAYKQQGLTWLVDALKLLPDTAVTAADKEALVGAAAVVVNGSGMGGESSTFTAAIDEFAELCRRNARIRKIAQQALLPPELGLTVVIK